MELLFSILEQNIPETFGYLLLDYKQKLFAIAYLVEQPQVGYR